TVAPSAPIMVAELPAPTGGTAGALDGAATQAPASCNMTPPATAAATNDPFVARLAAKEAENRARMEASYTAPPPSSSAPLQAQAPVEPMDTAVKETPKPASSKGFIWPVQGVVLSQFGDKVNEQTNDGINISAMEGQPIVAAADGEVVF